MAGKSSTNSYSGTDWRYAARLDAASSAWPSIGSDLAAAGGGFVRRPQPAITTQRYGCFEHLSDHIADSVRKMTSCL